MAVDIKIVPEKEEKKFPKLMISNNEEKIVLFTEPRCGIVLRDLNNNYETCEYVVEWPTEIFSDYNKPVVIENI